MLVEDKMNMFRVSLLRTICVTFLFVCNANGTIMFPDSENVEYTSSLEDIYRELQSNETEAFLSTFDNKFERETLYHQLAACPFTALCEYKLNVTFVQRTHSSTTCCFWCSCDYPHCIEDSNCCLDVLYRHPNGPSLNESQPIIYEDATLGCVAIQLPLVDFLNVRNSVLMKVSCPTNASEELDSNCTREISNDLQSFRDFVPVFDKTTQVQYKNIYCAYCNNIRDEDLERADIELTCSDMVQSLSETDIIQSIATESTCNVTFIFPLNTTFKNCLRTRADCNATGLWLEYDADIEQACHMYRSPILIDTVLYDNIFCAMCNGIPGTNQSECETFATGVVPYFSFSGLLKLQSAGERTHQLSQSENQQCSSSQLYDTLQDVCRDLYCPPHKSLIGGTCLDLFVKVERIIYSVNLKVTPLQTISLVTANNAASELLVAVDNLFRDEYICGELIIYKTDADEASELLGSNLQYFVIRMEIYKDFKHDVDQTVEITMSLDGLVFDIWKFDTTSRQMKSIGVKLQVIDYDFTPYDIMDNYTAMSSIYFDRDVDTLTKIENVFEALGGRGSTPGLELPEIDQRMCWLYYPAVDVLHILPCPKIKLSKDDIAWEHNDDGLIILDGDYFVDVSEFYFESSDTVVICSDVYEAYMSFMNQKVDEYISILSVETIVSVACTFVSIVCLMCTLLVFCVLPKLRQSIPGINHISLVSALLCAQSVYLVTGIGVFETGTPACITIGIVLHFIWLLSILWMNVCTYHMFSVLTNTTIISKDPITCRVGFYHLYALVMSSIPVAINIAVSLSTSGSYGYGDVACYISSQEMITYTFGIPVAFFTLANICMYMFVVIRLSIVKQVRRNVKNERNNLIIFVKLSTITGMSWMFGIVYSWTGLVVFSYLFIVLNASQGVFIMWAFVCNRRVVDMLKIDVLGYTTTASSQSQQQSEPMDNGQDKNVIEQ